MSKASITLEFAKLEEALTAGVQDILHANIGEFKKCVSEEVEASVYPMYSPKDYSRRGAAGGLAGENNYEVQEGALSLTLINRTMSNPDYWAFTYPVEITEIVEDGSGHGWVGVPARPFMEKALEKFAHEIIEPQINAMLGGI